MGIVMNLYAPEYYKEFRCIADKCTHSCCIGWEIDIDEETLQKYQALNGGYAEAIKNSIDFEETPHFRLCRHEKCPHLNQKGLCNIILNYGEGFLCEICREHPRFYNETANGLELGIGMACEEAARIILSAKNYQTLYSVGEYHSGEYEFDFNAVACREGIYKIISNEAKPYEERIKELYAFYGIYPNAIPESRWKEVIKSLEYLDQGHKELFLNYSSAVYSCADVYSERALAYFIYRHCSGATDQAEFYASLGFSLFLERLFASVIKSRGAKELAEISTLARIISEEIEYSADNTNAIKEIWL